MKRVLVLLCALFVGASGVSGQQTKPTNASDPQSWNTYTINGEEFSVSLPSMPALKTSKDFRPQIQKERSGKHFRLLSEGINYAVDVIENPNHQSLDELISDYNAAKDYEPSSARTITVDGISGREYSTSVNPPARVQFFVTERRFYRFIAVGGDDDNAAVKHFFSSIVLGKKADGIKVSVSPTLPSANTGEQVYKGKDVDKKVRLISKPFPETPEGERGLVILQAVFASNGKVVNIRVISSPGDRLTKAAIEAAQRITFEPAMKDGKAVSMFMQLEYNFNL